MRGWVDVEEEGDVLGDGWEGADGERLSGRRGKERGCMVIGCLIMSGRKPKGPVERIRDLACRSGRSYQKLGIVARQHGNTFKKKGFLSQTHSFLLKNPDKTGSVRKPIHSTQD